MRYSLSQTLVFLLILTIGRCLPTHAQLTIEYANRNGLSLTADWYPVSSDFPVILLCDQYASGKAETRETARRLNTFGYNCMALEINFGNESSSSLNEINRRSFSPYSISQPERAEQDMQVAIDYLHAKYKQPVILLAGSYAASLALKIAVNNDKISALALFSPGEYFSDKNYVRTNSTGLEKPLLISSSRSEAEAVTDLLRDVNSSLKIQFIPKSDGHHGAKVLWTNSPGNQEYWITLMNFLDRIKRKS